MDQIIKNIGNTATISSLITLSIGGIVSYFKFWIISEEKFCKKIKFLEEILKDGLNYKHLDLITKSLNPIYYSEDSTPQYDDNIKNYTNDIYKSIRIIKILDNMTKKISLSNTVLIVSVFIGILTLLISIILKDINKYLAITNYIIIFFQLCFIFLNIKTNREFRKLEQNL